MLKNSSSLFYVITLLTQIVDIILNDVLIKISDLIFRSQNICITKSAAISAKYKFFHCQLQSGSSLKVGSHVV